MSLKSETVNVRVGPGNKYPIKWLYSRPGLPVFVTASFETWRKIQDFEGSDGWIHQNMLSNKRSVIIIKKTHLHKHPSNDSLTIAELEQGVVLLLQEIYGNWVKLDMKKVSGWVERASIWGVDTKEKDQRY